MNFVNLVNVSILCVLIILVYCFPLLFSFTEVDLVKV